MFMVESLNNNLENVKAMALRLRGELDNYAYEQELAESWFSSSDEKTRKFLARILNGWREQGIKSPPTYISASNIPTCEEISEFESAWELDLCIDTLFNALRFLRLLGSVENELPASKNSKLSVEIIGDDIKMVETVSNTIRDSITRVLPFGILTGFSAPEGTVGPVHETINFKYIDGYDEDLQNAVVKTRIAIIAQNMGFEFDEEKMMVNII